MEWEPSVEQAWNDRSFTIQLFALPVTTDFTERGGGGFLELSMDMVDSIACAS